VVVDCGPCVVLEQWLFVSGSRSVRGTTVVAVGYWNAVRVWFSISGCVVVDVGPCMALDRWLCGKGTCSARGTRAVAVWWCIAFRAWY
jgi:hypothetical protein